jgi:hypothetical protein
VAEEVARVPAVGIALVVDPGERLRFRVRGQPRAREPEQRAQQGRASRTVRGHRGEPVRAGAAQKLQQQRLGLIVGMVGQRHGVDVRGAQARVARRARQRLEGFAAAALQVQPMRGQRHAALRTLRCAERRPVVGVRRQAVVDVDGGQRELVPRGAPDGGLEQHHRVDPARQGDGHTRTRGEVRGERRLDRHGDGIRRISLR